MRNWRIIGDPSHEHFSLDTSPFYLVAHIDHKYHEDMDKVLRKYGMTRPKYRVLHVLREHNPCNIGDLSDRAMIKKSTMSRIVERLRKEGLVKTTPNAADKRISDVALLPAGWAALEHVLMVGSRQFHRAIAGLTNKQIDTFIKTLHHVAENLNRLPLE